MPNLLLGSVQYPSGLFNLPIDLENEDGNYGQSFFTTKTDFPESKTKTFLHKAQSRAVIGFSKSTIPSSGQPVPNICAQLRLLTVLVHRRMQFLVSSKVVSTLEQTLQGVTSSLTVPRLQENSLFSLQ